MAQQFADDINILENGKIRIEEDIGPPESPAV